MTSVQANLLNLGIPINATVCIYIESALMWVLDNTTLEFDINNDSEISALPAQVRLFVLKYIELMSTSEGVTSESIEGLSQSYNTGDKSVMIWQLAESLLNKWLKSAVSFVPAKNRWA